MRARDAILLVARREFVERIRQKSFVISTLIILGVLALFTLLPVLLGFGDPPRYDIGLVGDSPAGLEQALAEQADVFGAEIDVVRLDDDRAAGTALRAEAIDIAVLGGTRLLAGGQPPQGLERIVQSASRNLRVVEELEAAGIGADQVAAVLNPPPLPVATLDDTSPEDTGGLETVAFVGAFLLYGQILGFGSAVASGVVEEKSTRIVEILLASVHPTHLLAGKVLGIGVLGLLQLVLLVTLALGMVLLTGIVELPPGTGGAVALVLFWFVLGYAFYSCAFAVAGALVSRQEEIQNTTAPLTLSVLASFFIAIAALNDPGSALATVASFLPPVAPLVMPVRAVLGEADAVALIGSAIVTALASTALVVLAARVYQGAILRTGGRVRIGDAWRGGDRSAA